MEKEKISVLYVDDEINNLNSFKANFRNIYSVYTAESAEEAKNILNSTEINVLITDQRMPNISGVQFLESILKDHPYPVRIILTGFTDLETVIEAINKGQIFRYVMKPFDVEELKLIIDNAYDLYLFRKSSTEALSKFKHFFENSPETVFNIDTNGNFNELNNTGMQLFGIKEEKLQTYTLSGLFVNQEDYRNVYARLLKDESVIDLPVKLKSYKGLTIEALMTVSRIRIEHQIIGFQGIIRDITKQKEIEALVIRTIIETQENERIRIGRNIHDSVGSMLAAVKVMLHGLTFKNEELKSNPKLIKIFEALNTTIIEMRNICFNIMPKSLEVLGLASAIKELCKQVQVPDCIEFELVIPSAFPKLNPQLEMSVFRIVQEFINNALTHGKSSKIDLDFSSRANQVYIKLKDNGTGFNIHAFNPGSGIKGVKSRIQSYSGEIKINSIPGVGTEYNIILPLMKPVSETILN
jgi:PAS domain S-box-containing protein